jgi:hypothetical protein
MSGADEENSTINAETESTLMSILSTENRIEQNRPVWRTKRVLLLRLSHDCTHCTALTAWCGVLHTIILLSYLQSTQHLTWQ